MSTSSASSMVSAGQDAVVGWNRLRIVPFMPWAVRAKPKKAPVKLVRPPAPVFERVDGDHTTLEGLTFVFTGVCGSISREECEDYVKMHGGKVTGSVSGNTKCERARGEGEARTGGGGR